MPPSPPYLRTSVSLRLWRHLRRFLTGFQDHISLRRQQTAHTPSHLTLNLKCRPNQCLALSADLITREAMTTTPTLSQITTRSPQPSMLSSRLLALHFVARSVRCHVVPLTPPDSLSFTRQLHIHQSMVSLCRSTSANIISCIITLFTCPLAPFPCSFTDFD